MFWLAVFLGTVIAIGAGMLAPRARRGRASRRLASGGTQVVDQAIVTVTGTIRALGEPVEAPLSGRPCVVVHATAELPEIDPKTHPPENVRLTTHRMVPFLLETAAGSILVEGELADLELVPSKISPRSIEREQAFVRGHGRGVEVAPVATFREIVVTPGMRVAVHGLARVTAAPQRERGYRDAEPSEIKIVAPPDYPLTIGRPRDS